MWRVPKFVVLVCLLVGLADGRRGKPRGKPDMVYYDLLGVVRQASDRDIRKAIKHHPDKHPNDPAAHDRFLEYTRAYEVLKDPDVRKKYDRLGKEGLEEDEKNGGGGGGGRGGGWHDSRYYEREFGLYDEDEQIDTMTSQDFWPGTDGGAPNSPVTGPMFKGDDIFFVNFYSPGCSHCHDLAPTWRELGTALNGAVGIGAVNCQDAWDVCRNMGIRSYPTLLIFRGNEQYEKYTGQRDLQSLVGFAIAGLPIPPSVSQSTRPPARSVVVVCVPDVYECEEEIEHRKLAASLVGIAGVYTLDCSRSPDVCKEWKLDDMPQAVWIDPAGEVVPFYPPLDGGGEPQNWGDVYSTTSLTEATLKMLPLPPSLDAERFSQFVDTPGGGKLSHNVAGTQEERAWSTIDARKACESNNEGIKRYTHYESVGHSTRGLNECKRLCEQDNACNGIDFYGNTGWCNLYTMPCATPARYDHGAQSLALKRGSGVRGIVVYFIDLTQKDPKVVELEREIRQMPHQQLERIGVMQFVVHCNELPQLCAQVRADMPEARLYKTMGHENYHGDAKAKSMLKWVHSSLTTNVIALSADDVEEILQMDPTSANGVSWFIDYYASWCPPCKEMLPHFRQASVMAGATVRFGSIDCNKYQAFCSEQGVTGYPSPAVYTANARSVAQWYDGDWDDANAFVEHINDIFNPPTTEITEHSWHNGWQADLHATKDVWLVLLTAGQWCGPCQQMNKMMKSVAKSSNGLYKVGIINCDVDRGLCDFLSVTGYPQLRRYRSSPGNDGTDGQLSGFIWNGHSFARNIINWAIEALPDGVMEMTEQTFNANVGSAGATAEAWFVTYSCPRWCRPCANWRPKQKQLAFMMGKTHRIRVAHIDCDDNRAFCNAQGIEAYPRALLYQPGIDHGQQVEIGSVDEVADYLRQVVELIPAERDAASKPPTEFDDVYNEFMQEDEIEDMYGEDDDNLDHDEF